MYPDDEELDAMYAIFEEGRRPNWPEMHLHLEAQDTSAQGWVALLQLVEEAIRDQREVFAPKQEIGPELWSQVVTLPPSIAQLKHVKKLYLYRVYGVRLDLKEPASGRCDLQPGLAFFALFVFLFFPAR